MRRCSLMTVTLMMMLMMVVMMMVVMVIVKLVMVLIQIRSKGPLNLSFGMHAAEDFITANHLDSASAESFRGRQSTCRLLPGGSRI